MRLALFLGAAVIAGSFAASPAMAQNTQTLNGYNAPIYVVPGSNNMNNNRARYNGNRQSPISPYYTAPAQQQAVPGVNAPSYNFGGRGAPMTSQEALAQRAARDQQAQSYQQQYMQQLGTAAQGAGMGEAYTNMTGMMTPQAQKPVPTKRRVVRREEDNPLSTPPRLFSID